MDKSFLSWYMWLNFGCSNSNSAWRHPWGKEADKFLCLVEGGTELFLWNCLLFFLFFLFQVLSCWRDITVCHVSCKLMNVQGASQILIPHSSWNDIVFLLPLCTVPPSITILAVSTSFSLFVVFYKMMDNKIKLLLLSFLSF